MRPAERADWPGSLTAFTCPDCRGVLRVVEEGEVVRFTCSVGHAFSAESLLTGQSEELESALWSAVAALEEQADLCRRLADRMDERDRASAAQRFERQAQEAERKASAIRAATLALDLDPGDAALTEEG